MSISASLLRTVYKLSGAKKAFALPEDALQKKIEKQNRHRGVFTPTDRKAYYETIPVNGFPCLSCENSAGNPAVMCGSPFIRSVRSTALRKPMIWCMNATTG